MAISVFIWIEKTQKVKRDLTKSHCGAEAYFLTSMPVVFVTYLGGKSLDSTSFSALFVQTQVLFDSVKQNKLHSDREM